MRPILELAAVMLSCLAIGVVSAFLVQAAGRKRKPVAPVVRCPHGDPGLRRGVDLYNHIGRFHRREAPRA